MKRFYASTALAAVLVTSAPALANIETHGMFRTQAEQGEILGSDLIGARVYAAEGGYAMTDAAGMQTEWNDVGEINDLVLGRDGEIDAVLVDIGGFLGIGERQVALNMNQIKFVDDSSTDEEGDFFLVIPASLANLEEAPEYPTMHSAMPVMVGRDGYEAIKMEDLTAEDLTGARVYGVNDEDIGEVSKLILDGAMIDKAVIDVGGFLGLGEKPVALDMDKLKILRGDNGSDVRVYVNMTEESFEAMPTYEN